MKKSYLAAAAILGAAVFAGEAHAVKIDLGKTKFKMGFRAKVHATLDGIHTNNDVSDLKIDVPFTRIYAKGSISKIFKWGWQMEFGKVGKAPAMTPGKVNTPEFIDSFIILDFAKEFRIFAGSIKVPWERHAGIQSGWSFIVPTGPTYGIEKAPSDLFKNPFKNDRNKRSGSRSNQIGVWGDIAGGMLRYYLSAVDSQDAGADSDRQTGFAVRVQLTPTMLGYKGDKGYVLKETYLGKRNVLTLGLSYASQGNFGDNKGDQMSAPAVDLMWEQNFGSVTPNISVGWTQLSIKDASANTTKTSQGILAQGQILFNTKTILGKPAIGVKYVQADPDTKAQDDAYSTFSVVGQLYVKGVGNRIALVVDSVNVPKNTPTGAKATKPYTDVTLAMWFNF